MSPRREHSPASEKIRPYLLHVAIAIFLRLDGQRAEAVREEIDDRDFQFGEEVLQLRHPLHPDETGAADEDGGALLV